MPEPDALFECAVQAQLSQSRMIKSNINNLFRGILVAGFITYWFMQVFGKQSFSYNDPRNGQLNHAWTEDPRTQEKKKALGVLIGGLSLTFLWWLRDQYTQPQISKSEFETGKLWIHLAVVNQLLTDEKTAPIAVQGMALAAQQYRLFAKHSKHSSQKEREQLETAYQTVNTRVQHWIANHSNTQS